MKYLFLLSACVLLSFNGAYAQTQIFNETFETNSATVGSWTTVDRGTTGNYWQFGNLNGFGFSSRVAYCNSGPTTDVLFTSPSVTLSLLKNYNLSFLFGVSTPSTINHYAVYILLDGNAFSGSENAVLEETWTQAEAVVKTVDISAYAGHSIKICFRYFNTDFHGSGIDVDNVIVTESVTSGISASSESAAVSLSPSPVGSQLQVSVAGGNLQKVEVVDLNGRVARSVAASGASASVDVSGLAAGVYVAKVLSGDGTVVRKFVKK